MLALIVTADFGDYRRGDQITDPEIVAALRDSTNAGNVVPVVLPDPPAA